MSPYCTRRLLLPPIAAAILTIAGPRLRATDGMNLEGYGPIATAMGGASMAYDNGTAAVINNPATLGLMADQARLDVALGVLGPHISVTSPAAANNLFGVAPNQEAKSTATAFFMPAFGYAKRAGDLVWGFGVFGQGGMGCEYDPGSWRGLGYGLRNRTEVSVGRAIAPLVYRINDKLQIGATADFVWAGMDLEMAMSGAQFFDLVTPGSQVFGRASGSIVQSFGQVMRSLPAGSSVDYAYFNFSNGNPFTGEARGYGYGGKVGVVYTPTDTLAFGAAYHSPTALSDLKARGDFLSFQLRIPGMGAMPQTLTGDFRVRDFQWPAMLGGGVSWRPQARWMLVADVREIFWQAVMKQFEMSFTAYDTAANGAFAGQSLDAALFQDWSNQTVAEIGAAYQASRRLTLRFGGNFANDPIPDKYLNCLFPAMVRDHLTAGCGWRSGAHSSVNLSAAYGFKASAVNGAGVTIEHSQTNAQVMYSYAY